MSLQELSGVLAALVPKKPGGVVESSSRTYVSLRKKPKAKRKS